MRKTIGLIAVALVLFGVPAQAEELALPNPGLLPGHVLYFLDGWAESIQAALTFDPSAKAERLARQAEERLAEARALAARGETERAERTVARYEEQLTKAQAQAEVARIRDDQQAEDVLARVAESTLRHQAVLAEVYERVPEQAKPSIEQAMDRSLRGYEASANALSGQKREELESRTQSLRQQAADRLNVVRGRSGSVETVPADSTQPAQDERAATPVESAVPAPSNDAAVESPQPSTTSSGDPVLDEACVTRIAEGKTSVEKRLTPEEEVRIQRECFSR